MNRPTWRHVVCLPEHFPTMGLPRLDAARLAEGEDLHAVEELAPVLQRYGLTLVMGVHRRASDGHLYNSAVVVEGGQAVGLFDKVHPTQSEQAPRSVLLLDATSPFFAGHGDSCGTHWP